MNPEKVPLKDLTVLGFWSHKPSRYPADRQWFACFSNWYPCSFKLKLKQGHEDKDHDDGVEYTYNCVEQLMMHAKALRYGDKDIADLILKETDPAKMKDLGRRVKNYNDRDWGKVRYAIVTRSLKAKFQQNPDLKAHLMKTEGKIVAEASASDLIWGIGLAPSDPKTQDPTQWRGTNLLGNGLMEVRNGF